MLRRRRLLFFPLFFLFVLLLLHLHLFLFLLSNSPLSAVSRRHPPFTNLRLCTKPESNLSRPDLLRSCPVMPIITSQQPDLNGWNPLSVLTHRPYVTAIVNHRHTSSISTNRRAPLFSGNTSPRFTFCRRNSGFVLPPPALMAPPSNRISGKRLMMPDSGPVCAVTAAKPSRAVAQPPNPNPVPYSLLGLAQSPMLSVSNLSSPSSPPILLNPFLYLTMNGCLASTLIFNGSSHQPSKISGIKSLLFQVYQKLDLCVINENIWDISLLAVSTSLCSYSPSILLLDVYETISKFVLDDSRKPAFCNKPDFLQLPIPSPFLLGRPWPKPDTLLRSVFMDCMLFCCRPLSRIVLQTRLFANPMEPILRLSFPWHGGRCICVARLSFVLEEDNRMSSLSAFIEGSTLLSAAIFKIDNSNLEAISIPSISSLFVFVISHHAFSLLWLQVIETRGLLHLVCCRCKMAVSILCFNAFRLLYVTAVSAALTSSSFVINFSINGG